MNDSVSDTIHHYRTKVDRSLLIRQGLFVIIILILIVISVLNVWEGKLYFYLATGGFLLATLVGIALSRMFRIFWHEEKKKVISQLDAFGAVLLVAYIAIEVFRKWIFQHWLSGATLNAFGLIVVAGLLLGRFLGTFAQIKTVLEENIPEVD